MSSIDAYRAGPEERPANMRRIDAVNQRDAWLRQMETAQLAGMHQRAPDAPAAQAGRLHHSALAPTASQVVKPSASASPHSEASPADSPLDDAASAPASHAAGAVASGHNVTSAGMHGQTAATGDAKAAAARMAASLRAPGAALPVTPALRGRPSAAPRQEPETARNAEPDTSQPPTWHKRIMHLTGDGDDVQLWIRDGKLSPAASQQLVARLSCEVADMGLRLKQATINGKPALRTATQTDALPEAGATLFAPAAADIGTDASAKPAMAPTLFPITHPITER